MVILYSRLREALRAVSHHLVFFFAMFSPANARAILGGSVYGNATEGYWLRSVQCVGTETDIASCPHSNWNDTASCDIYQSAGVSCLPDSAAAPPREYR